MSMVIIIDEGDKLHEIDGGFLLTRISSKTATFKGHRYHFEIKSHTVLFYSKSIKFSTMLKLCATYTDVNVETVCLSCKSLTLK